MLKDPKATRPGRELRRCSGCRSAASRASTRIPKLFPQLRRAAALGHVKETELFFEAIVREDRSILDLIDADFTFLNERLARHYGIIDTNGNRPARRRRPAASRSARDSARALSPASAAAS